MARRTGTAMAIKNTEKYQRLATHARACLYVRILHRLASPLQRTAADSEAKMLESTIKLLHFDLRGLSQKGQILCALFHTMDSKASCTRAICLLAAITCPAPGLIGAHSTNRVEPRKARVASATSPLIAFTLGDWRM